MRERERDRENKVSARASGERKLQIVHVERAGTQSWGVGARDREAQKSKNGEGNRGRKKDVW